MILKKEVIEELSKRLSLPFAGIEQDWALEMASSEKLDDFLRFYKRHGLSKDERVALISLILASYEDFLNENDLDVDDRWNAIMEIIDSDRTAYQGLLEYWSLNESDLKDVFRITPLIRKLKSISTDH